jgi:hypothetical protein
LTTSATEQTHVRHFIERLGDPLPSYLSEKIGRDYGHPYGGWTSDIEQATVYEKEAAEKLLSGPMAYMAPFCKVVAK